MLMQLKQVLETDAQRLKKLEQEKYLKQQQERKIQAYIKSEIEKLVSRGSQEPNERTLRVSSKMKVLHTAMSKKDSMNEEKKERLNKPRIRETYIKQKDIFKEMDTRAYIKSELEKMLNIRVQERKQEYVPVSTERMRFHEAKTNFATSHGNNKKSDNPGFTKSYVKEKEILKIKSPRSRKETEFERNMGKDAKIPEIEEKFQPLHATTSNILKGELIAYCNSHNHGNSKELTVDKYLALGNMELQQNEVMLEDMELECLVNETQINYCDENEKAVEEVKSLYTTGVQNKYTEMLYSNEDIVVGKTTEPKNNIETDIMTPKEKVEPLIPFGGCLDDSEVFEFGENVIVSGKVPGIIKYVGYVHFAEGLWIGVEVFEPIARHDGTHDGKRYFDAPTKCGVFAPPWKVLPLIN